MREVLDSTVTLVAGVEPNCTVAPLVKPVPVIETVVPPVTSPQPGRTRPPRLLDAADCVPASRRALLTGRSRVAGGELSVNAVGFGELIFQDDDATGGFQRVALVDQFTCAAGQPQLVARVAAMAAG